MRTNHEVAEASDWPTLDVIVVNWNTGDQLRTCLASLTNARHDAFYIGNVFVVDNASSDGSANGLDELDLPLTVLRNKENRGFAAACNQAAAASRSRYILFLNPDTRVTTDSILRPVEFLEKPSNGRVGIVGIQLLNDQGTVSLTCARFLTAGMILRKMIGLDYVPPFLWTPHFMVDWDHKTTRQVDHVMGAFFLVRNHLFQELGGFDERFFVYLEDLDFSLRAKAAGFETFYLAGATAYHKGGGATAQVKATSLYYALASRILYGYKHFGRGVGTLLAIGTLFFEPFSRVAVAIARRSPSQVRDTLKAYSLLWRALPRGLVVTGSPDAI